jgi:hypothetical protein
MAAGTAALVNGDFRVAFCVHASFAASLGGVKGKNCRLSVISENLTGFAPGGTVFDDPISQGAFKSDVVAGFFRFNPFMFQDFIALGLKFAVKRRVFQQIVRY